MCKISKRGFHALFKFFILLISFCYAFWEELFLLTSLLGNLKNLDSFERWSRLL